MPAPSSSADRPPACICMRWRHAIIRCQFPFWDPRRSLYYTALAFTRQEEAGRLYQLALRVRLDRERERGSAGGEREYTNEEGKKERHRPRRSGEARVTPGKPKQTRLLCVGASIRGVWWGSDVDPFERNTRMLHAPTHEACVRGGRRKSMGLLWGIPVDAEQRR